VSRLITYRCSALEYAFPQREQRNSLQALLRARFWGLEPVAFPKTALEDLGFRASCVSEGGAGGGSPGLFGDLCFVVVLHFLILLT
jgi:hypothetical protein